MRRNGTLDASLLATVGMIVLGLSTAGCDTPSEPPTPARVETRGNLSYRCGIDCEYEGEAVNRGAGCARNVRGVTRIFDGGGGEIARDDWSLDPSLTMRPNEVVLFRGCCFGVAQVNAARSFSTRISWDDTSC